MSGPDDVVQVKRLDTPASLRARLAQLGADLPVDDLVDPGPGGALAQPLTVPLPGGDRTVANRFTILPMEGWDGTADGRPTELVRRRWRRFGRSGAAVVWGGEAVAVTADGRANPNQLWFGPEAEGDLASLRDEVVAGHVEAMAALEAAGVDPAVIGSAGGSGAGGAASPLLGLQLTHSGRWARPEGVPAPRTAYRHPVLDDRVGAGDEAVLSDAELDDLVAAFVRAAQVAAAAGFDFVDVKQCHGYLGHELLSAVDRAGPYGGDLDGRTRFVRSVIAGIRSAAPSLGLGVRLSLFDIAPHAAGPDGVGVAQIAAGSTSYPYAFGGDGTGAGIDLTEVHALVDRLVDGGVTMLCATASSPYYAPHAQRPAFFPPSDGYLPPRDPLVDVAVLQGVTAQVSAAHPQVVVVGSGLTYVQDWFAHVAQPLVAGGWFDSAGLGRMVLSYPTLPLDVLAGRALDRRAVCRTFSDCTTAPRQGLVSGCYPLDPFYKERPERVELTRAKRAAEAARGGRRRSAR
ncbi:MAG: NADH:flavin oxidoreductase [Acidimicrobiales bacterium]